jgi:outer membrane protein
MHNRRKTMGFGIFSAIVIACGSLSARNLQAQSQALPDAPKTSLFLSAAQTPQDPATQATSAQAQAMTAPTTSAEPNAPKLTVAQAEQMALKNNPNISVAQLFALAKEQVTREVFSAELPTVTGALVATDSNLNGRLAADAQAPFDNPRIINRFAGGAEVNQLITDFGHTGNLVRSAKFNAKAQVEQEKATELDITLVTDQAFYDALTAQAVLKVAKETVYQRESTDEQVRALTKFKLRSDVDLSFADVQVSRAKLFLLDAQNNEETTMAALDDVLGQENSTQYSLVDETNNHPEPAPDDPEAMVKLAFTQRPDLAALNSTYAADQHFARAERDLWMPSLTALGAAGGEPIRGDKIQRSWYAIAGVNLSVPIFNGFLFNAEESQAKLQAKAAQEQVRNLTDNIARDVRTAVFNAQTAYQKIAVTEQMLYQANYSLALASARYKMNLSGIVEITQAQLEQAQAAVDNATARYNYQTAMAILHYELGE